MRNRSGRTSAMRAAIYLRCSSDDQKEGDFSTLDVQRELNQALIAERG
jgi:DNA invertase Pin-like site-specific DNA recombinase